MRVRREEAQAVGWLANHVYQGDAGCIPALVEYLLSLLSEQKECTVFVGTPEFRNFIAYRIRRYLYDRMIVRKGKRRWKSEEELGRIVVSWAFGRVKEVKMEAKAELRKKRNPQKGCQEESFRKAVDATKDILSRSYGYDPITYSLDEPLNDEEKRTRLDLLPSSIPTPEEVFMLKASEMISSSSDGAGGRTPPQSWSLRARCFRRNKYTRFTYGLRGQRTRSFVSF